MKNHTHITQNERGRIAVLRNRGLTWRVIGKSLASDRSALIRQYHRNRPQKSSREYLPHKTQQRAEFGQRNSHKRIRLKSRVLRFEVEQQLLLGWSPEIIAGRFRRERPELPTIAPEAIDQWVYAEAPHLIDCLLRSHPRRGRKSRHRTGHKVIIPHRVPIGERPSQAQERKEPGHWGSDLMTGRGGRAVIQTSVERVSRYTKISTVADKTARRCRKVLEAVLRPLPPHLRRSITYDNGTANTKHHLLNQKNRDPILLLRNLPQLGKRKKKSRILLSAVGFLQNPV